MKRVLASAAVVTAAFVAPFTPALPETPAHAKEIGGCAPRDKPAYFAAGSWGPWGVTLSGRTNRGRWQRDTVTTVRVPGVGTYSPAGVPREFYASKPLRSAPTATVTVHIGSGLLRSTHRCTFELVREEQS